MFLISFLPKHTGINWMILKGAALIRYPTFAPKIEILKVLQCLRRQIFYGTVWATAMPFKI